MATPLRQAKDQPLSGTILFLYKFAGNKTGALILPAP
jgi:hypothetical protein